VLPALHASPLQSAAPPPRCHSRCSRAAEPHWQAAAESAAHHPPPLAVAARAARACAHPALRLMAAACSAASALSARLPAPTQTRGLQAGWRAAARTAVRAAARACWVAARGSRSQGRPRTRAAACAAGSPRPGPTSHSARACWHPGVHARRFLHAPGPQQRLRAACESYRPSAGRASTNRRRLMPRRRVVLRSGRDRCRCAGSQGALAAVLLGSRGRSAPTHAPLGRLTGLGGELRAASAS